MDPKELISHLKSNDLPGSFSPNEQGLHLQKYLQDNRDCLGLGSLAMDFDGTVNIQYGSSNMGKSSQPYPNLATSQAPWIQVAQGELGTREMKVGSNARIEEYLRAAGNSGSDEIPWCAAFTTWCMQQVGVKGAGASSLNWRNWGVPAVPGTIGSIVVFYREGGGHIGFCVGVEGANIKVLGGNQSDAVTISTRKFSDVIAWRWPAQ